MSKFISILGTLALLLSLAACASPSGAEISSSCCQASKTDGTSMKCDSKKMSCACCAKGEAGGKAPEGHQH